MVQHFSQAIRFLPAVAMSLAAVLAAAPAWAQDIDLPSELTDGKIGDKRAADAAPADAPAEPAADAEPAPADPLVDGPTQVTPETVGRIPDDAVEKDPQRIVARWKSWWRLYAMKYAPLDGDYVALPTYDRRYDSSRGITTAQLIAQATQEVRVAAGGLARTLQIKPDRDDAQLAAESIPDIKVGEYGRIMSAKVEQIVGPEEMVVSDVWLVDAKAAEAEKQAKIASVPEIPRPNTNVRRPRGAGRNSDYNRYQRDRQRRIQAQYQANVRAREQLIKRIESQYEAREELAKRQDGRQFQEPIVVKGYSTAGLKPGERWTGRGRERPQIAIVAVQRDEEARGRRSRSRYVAVPPITFLRGLDESQFLDLLHQRGVSPAEFVNMILKFKQADPSSERIEMEVFTELEKRRGARAE